MKIEELIKTLRIQNGKTQFQLAIESGVSLPTIQKIESGKANPGLQVVESILKSLNYHIQFSPLTPDWDLLASYGVPLTSKIKIKPPLQVKKLLPVLKSSLSFYSHQNQATSREWEALAAFILALKTHFHDFYEQLGPFKENAEKLMQQQSPARLYKLRRLAILAQAKYL